MESYSTSAEGDQSSIASQQKAKDQETKLAQNFDEQNDRDDSITLASTGLGGGSIAVTGLVKWWTAAAGTGCTGTTTILGPALVAGGVMIGVGVNQIRKSTEMIEKYDARMDKMSIDLNEIHQALVNEGANDQLSDTINGAFVKCIKCNKAKKQSLEDEYKSLSQTIQTYDQQVKEYQDTVASIAGLAEAMQTQLKKALQQGLVAAQKNILTHLEKMQMMVLDIRNEYEILRKLFDAKVEELKQMKEKAEHEASKSRWMGWICAAVGVACAAAMFIPGVNAVAAAGLYVSGLCGASINIALQLNANRVDGLVRRISSKIDTYQSHSDNIQNIMDELDKIAKELGEIRNELNKKFQEDGDNYTKLDSSYLDRVKTKVERAAVLSTKFLDDMDEASSLNLD